MQSYFLNVIFQNNKEPDLHIMVKIRLSRNCDVLRYALKTSEEYCYYFTKIFVERFFPPARVSTFINAPLASADTSRP